MHLMDDREPYPDEDDPANEADALGDGINADNYFDELDAYLADVAESVTADDDDTAPQDEAPA